MSEYFNQHDTVQDAHAQFEESMKDLRHHFPPYALDFYLNLANLVHTLVLHSLPVRCLGSLSETDPHVCFVNGAIMLLKGRFEVCQAVKMDLEGSAC